MNAGRLLKLADFLDTVHPRKFCLAYDTTGYVENLTDTKECGSSACAIGWTPHVFPKLVSYGHSSDGPQSFVIRGHIYQWCDVAEKLFNLPWDTAKQLFAPLDENDDPLPKQMARRIRRFVKTGKISK